MSENISKKDFGGAIFSLTLYSEFFFYQNQSGFTEGMTKHLGLGYCSLGHGIGICSEHGF